MKPRCVLFVAVVGALSLVLTSCAQAGSAPTPTQAPVVPTKSAAPVASTPAPVPPTKAPEPSKATSFPEKGKILTMVVPFEAGGGADSKGRIIAESLEKELGIQVQVVNKPGASSQAAMTELARQTKPDGYTILLASIPMSITAYLDPERKAQFGLKDLQMVAAMVSDPFLAGVPADSPFKTAKDLVDAAKAKPETIKVAITGLLGGSHLALLELESAVGVKFLPVPFNDAAKVGIAVAGGHVDATVACIGDIQTHLKSGAVRPVGLMQKTENKNLPGVKTFESSGYKVFPMAAVLGAIAPASTPKDVVDILDNAIKKSLESPDAVKRLDGLGVERLYMSSTDFADFWKGMDSTVKPLIEQQRQNTK